MDSPISLKDQICLSYIEEARCLKIKWTRPFLWKTKSGFCACAIAFQTCSTPSYLRNSWYAVRHLTLITAVNNKQDRQSTYKRNTEGHSSKHSCRGKAIKYYVLKVCVCSLSYSACNAHATYCRLWPVRLFYIFPHIISQIARFS